MNPQEKTLAQYHVDKMKEQRKYFEYADLSQNILEQQKDDDLLLLQEWLTNLHSNLKKDDKRRNEILLLIRSTWRIEHYFGSLETICKASTVRVFNLLKRQEELESQVRMLGLQSIQDNAKYELEKKKLEREIEFITKK